VKTLCAAVVVLALVSPASANQWQIEVVDTCGTWTLLQLGIAPDGVVHLCYSGSNRVLCHAYRDSMWHRETVGTFPSLAGASWNMDIGTHSELGLLLNLAGGSVGLLEKHDSTWTMDSVPITTADASARLSWDSAGNPAVAYMKQSHVVMGYAVHSDSGWVCETLTIGSAWTFAYLGGFVYTVRNEPCAVIGLSHLNGVPEELLYIKQQDTWREYGVDVIYNKNSSLAAMASAPDFDSAAALCDNWTLFGDRGFRYASISGTSPIEESTQAKVAGLAISTTGTPHVSYVDANTNGPLKHAYRAGSTWVKDTVLNGNISLLGGIDLLDGVPIVAFYEPGAGICVAGMLTPGISEHPIEVGRAAGQASLLNPRSLIVTERGFVLDLSGRKVIVLHPGTNDVGFLPVGVYFVCPMRKHADPERPSVTKVVVQR
jgi:hypothetical protein